MKPNPVNQTILQYCASPLTAGRHLLQNVSLLTVLLVGLLFPGPAASQSLLPAGPSLAVPSGDIARHEPIFGLGPRTIWDDGWGLEVGLDRDKADREESWGLDYHVLYGLTVNWSVTAEMHQVLTGTGDHTSGLSDLMLRSKYRFFHNDVPGGVYHAAVLGGVEFPTATGGLSAEASTDVFGGLSGAYEGRRWLLFLTGRYRVNSEGADNVRPGNAFLYDAALGLRPVLTGYYQPDVVLMGELNGQVFGRREVNGAEVVGSAGDRLLASFGLWVTYRNWALKPGIQMPVYNDVPGGHLDYRFVVAAEVHL